MHHVFIYTSQQQPIAFLSFLNTTEPDQRGRARKVLYCYELQVSPRHQGVGLGSMLLGILEEEARRALKRPIVMLTCFTRNEAAMRFYLRHGYTPDPISPSQSLQGDSETVEYEILSKQP